ncbi:Hypothetical protein ERS075562_05531 [Mycobacteroides abscessus]|nr:Hypothetical protein ERS075562_05531 [Mycobacteroides abscessus]
MEAKLADHGFTMRDAEAIAERVAQALGDEWTFFNGLTHGLAADADSASVGFTSVLWLFMIEGVERSAAVGL